MGCAYEEGDEHLPEAMRKLQPNIVLVHGTGHAA